MQLTDLAREIGGWPIRIDRIAELLERADKVLPGGRDNHDELTDEQIRLLCSPKSAKRKAELK